MRGDFISGFYCILNSHRWGVIIYHCPIKIKFSTLFSTLMLGEINREEERRSGKSEKLWPTNMATRIIILLGGLFVKFFPTYCRHSFREW